MVHTTSRHQSLGKRSRHIQTLLMAFSLIVGLIVSDLIISRVSGDTTALETADETKEITPDAKEASPQQDPSLGSLSGTITFTGKPVPPRIVQVTKDVETCKKAGEPIQEVTVSGDGNLTGVVIEIQGADPPSGEWTWNEPKDGYTLRQEHCSFSPRVLVIKNGANVKVFNDDKVAHNVNTGQWNVMQPNGAAVIDKPIKSRRPVRVGCNIHSWMEAWVYPAQSPLYAVSDTDGNFNIPNVPPGKYRAVAWHPALRQQRLRITIEAGKATTQDVAFKSPLK